MFRFEKLTQENAQEIADNWKYKGEYSFYDMTADPEDYEEFTQEALRNANDHYQAIFQGELVGYFCVFPNGRELEIGLGLRPDWCGRGMGKRFLEDILLFVEKNYGAERYIMNVALFNQRAIKVYRSCGFQDADTSDRETNGSIYPFLRMTRER